MANRTTLPQETLAAYQVACELLVAVKMAEIADLKLRDQALRAAKSVCLNIAEATGRTGADQKRVVCIARGEASETVAALHIAGLCGDCDADCARPGGSFGPQGLCAAEQAYPLLIANFACAVTTPKALARACS
jgi:four helix bundle protein